MKYKDKVKIKHGFYRGLHGTVVKEIETIQIGSSQSVRFDRKPDPPSYNIKLRNGTLLKEVERDEFTKVKP